MNSRGHRICQSAYYLADIINLEDGILTIAEVWTMITKHKSIYNINAYGLQQYQQTDILFFLDVVEDVILGKYVRAEEILLWRVIFPVYFADEANVPGFIQIEILA